MLLSLLSLLVYLIIVSLTFASNPIDFPNMDEKALKAFRHNKTIFGEPLDRNLQFLNNILIERGIISSYNTNCAILTTFFIHKTLTYKKGYVDKLTLDYLFSTSIVSSTSAFVTLVALCESHQQFHFVGFSGGAVGNHLQLYYKGANDHFILDPLLGFVASVPSLDDVLNGIKIPENKIISIFSKNEKPEFSCSYIQTTSALINGLYRKFDKMYHYTCKEEFLDFKNYIRNARFFAKQLKAREISFSYFSDSALYELEELMKRHKIRASSDGKKAIISCLLSYNSAKYGPGNALTEENIRKAETLNCANQGVWMWFMYPNVSYTFLGFSTDGPFGNHAQLFLDDGKNSLLLDPTFGIVFNTTLLELFQNKRVPQNKIISFYNDTQPELDYYYKRTMTAVINGLYDVNHLIYLYESVSDYLNNSNNKRDIFVKLFRNSLQTS